MVVLTCQVLLTFLQFLAWILALRVATAESFIVQRVKSLFFPAMVTTAIALHRTSLFVSADKVTGCPVRALLKGVVRKVMRFAPEVLPVMCIHALSFIMVLIKRTPFSLKVVHIELLIFRHSVNKGCFNV